MLTLSGDKVTILLRLLSGLRAHGRLGRIRTDTGRGLSATPLLTTGKDAPVGLIRR